VKDQQGNVLVIILIAVILLAALSFAVTKGGQGGAGKSLLSEGDAKIAAIQILKYAKSVENAIKKLQLTNGCSENQISFENSVVTGYANANSPVDNSCNIFDVNGGGLNWQGPISGANDGSQWIFSGRNRIPNIGTSSGDLAIILPNITKNLCIEINRTLGLGAAPSGDPDYFSANKFDGAYGVIAVASWGGNKNFCVQTTTDGSGTVGGNYYFISTLIAR
jgi:hypothetical protein